ncbi:DUF2235 domain-containing protein [Leptospira stimsonii]|uniref:T6SS Phospholipase effector Tle1-like catalytic domain-containing protein n=1 Tax=Leptospira stimsonii TaxID=2202203 RepID=A0A396YWQ2_9LEPT|nr:DUF2235 domain-containing protein [Leptospira stimsonii]RHX85794.1 hypothetical protein DLM75_19935 [Leptospira stimsonii]
MKKIVLFCDGTWNDPEQTDDGVLAVTNVRKLFLAFQNGNPEIHPRPYYDKGIGTSGNVLWQILAGLSGTGISENIRQAYRFIIKNYEFGDEIFLFGFSRGAFTVRSLAGLIRNCGILKMEEGEKLKIKVNEAYEIYRSRKPKDHPNSEESKRFRERESWPEADLSPVRFIGVWDTVGALGIPITYTINPLWWRNRFHDTLLSSKILYAYQALAIDERRSPFRPTLWQKDKKDINQTMEQVWFVGVHSDVGGGYKDSQLSDIALQWLKEKAESCGLTFASMEINPSSFGTLHDSASWYLPSSERPIGEEKNTDFETNETLHESVLQRYAKDSSYRPNNLETYLQKHSSLKSAFVTVSSRI